MTWFLFFSGFGCGGLTGLIMGKLLTERELSNHASIDDIEES